MWTNAADAMDVIQVRPGFFLQAQCLHFSQYLYFYIFCDALGFPSVCMCSFIHGVACGVVWKGRDQDTGYYKECF